MNVIEEYLVKIGAVVDESGMRRFQNAIREAASIVDTSAVAMGTAFFKAQTEIVAGFAAIGGAAIGMADKVAMADQEYRLFALHMYMSKDAARSLKVAMDALGQPLENLSWDPELRARTRQLIADQHAMAPEGDFDAQMKKIRDIRFEFTRMEVEMKYLGMHVVQDFMHALGMQPDWLLGKLQEFNHWVIVNLPAISDKLVRWFLPIWKDIKEVFAHTGTAMLDTANAFGNLVGLLTGDNAITKASNGFEKFGLAVQKVSHIFAVFAETVADFEDMLAHLLSALTKMATGDFSGAATELKGAWKDVNARTVGAAVMVGSAFLAPELLPEEAEGAVGGAGIMSRLAARGIGLVSRHPVVAGAIGANIGDLISPSGSATPALIAALQGQESGALGMSARSSKGAIGTMQLMPGTAASLGVNPYDPTQNVAGGTKYLNQLLARYHGNVAEALGAYNAGPGRMDAFLAGKATLPGETQNYIARVLGRAGQSGDVTIGSVTIHIVQKPGESSQELADRTVATLREASGKQTQRNLVEFNNLGWSY